MVKLEHPLRIDSYKGGPFQEAVSAVTILNTDAYESQDGFGIVKLPSNTSLRRTIADILALYSTPSSITLVATVMHT